MKAQRVLGPVTDNDLGLTLMHEHILFDFSVCPSAPATPGSGTVWLSPAPSAPCAATLAW